jgi:hypothetical protein
MPTTEYEVPLDETGLEWVRFRFTTRGGQVTAFTVQYETTVAGRRVPVVRYDNAHGFAHRDLLDRRGQISIKETLAGAPTPADALQIGERDIRENWQRYRRDFLRDGL